MKTADQLKKLASKFRKKAKTEKAIKYAQVIEGMAALKIMERQLNS